MIAKITAVEWLINELKENIGLKDLYAIKQAKEMEKKQMFDYIKKNYVNGKHSLKFHLEEFENYYNETFKSK